MADVAEERVDQRLAALERSLDKIDGKLDRLIDRTGSVETRLAALDATL